MTVFFTSDPHYWHANVIKYCTRPYSSVEEMNEAMIKNWNSVVGPEDTVYVLGDFSLAIRPVEAISSRLMGIKCLVPGNHDWCHSYNKKARGEGKLAKWITKYEDHGWIVLPEQTILDIPGVATVNMCHHPYEEDVPFEGDKYARWRLKNDGRWLLCGHVHEKWKTKGKQINVGVDVWNYTPVSIDEISRIILNDCSRSN
jgi:calcineurin-like phosphoesterase family protein